MAIIAVASIVLGMAAVGIVVSLANRLPFDDGEKLATVRIVNDGHETVRIGLCVTDRCTAIADGADVVPEGGSTIENATLGVSETFRIETLSGSRIGCIGLEPMHRNSVIYVTQSKACVR